MTITSKKLTTTTAATFAAALTSLYAAPELQAQAVDLVIMGGPVTGTGTFSFITAGPDANSVGGSLFLLGPNYGGANIFSAGSFGAGLAVVGPGVLSAGNFPAGGSSVDFGPSATGTAFVGFELTRRRRRWFFPSGLWLRLQEAQLASSVDNSAPTGRLSPSRQQFLSQPAAWHSPHLHLVPQAFVASVKLLNTRQSKSEKKSRCLRQRLFLCAELKLIPKASAIEGKNFSDADFKLAIF